jgi:hypothetical protein
MSAPGEHKTVQARVLRYAFVPRAEAEARHGLKAAGVTPAERSRGASLFDIPCREYSTNIPFGEYLQTIPANCCGWGTGPKVCTASTRSL